MQLPTTMPSSQTIPRPSPIRLNLPSVGSSYMPSTMLPGYYVNSDDDISARDVPNDGSISFFPAKDLSHIVIKQWNGNALESAVYVLRQSQVAQQQEQSTSSLPPPPPPVMQGQQNAQSNDSTEALLRGFTQMNEGMANAFSQLGASMNAIRDSMEAINRKLGNEGGVG